MKHGLFTAYVDMHVVVSCKNFPTVPPLCLFVFFNFLNDFPERIFMIKVISN